MSSCFGRTVVLLTVLLAACDEAPSVSVDALDTASALPLDAAAPPGCTGYACDGKDPMTMGCNADAITVVTDTMWSGLSRVGTVELRWSRACEANWTRVTRLKGSNADPMTAKVIRKVDNKAMTETLTGYRQIYSDMVHGKNLPCRAWGQIHVAGSAYWDQTGWY